MLRSVAIRQYYGRYHNQKCAPAKRSIVFLTFGLDHQAELEP